MAEQGLHHNLPELLLAWYDSHARILPWRAKPGELADPYRVWLSEIMLQQTTVGAVKDYFLKFTRLWPTVQDLAAAPLDDVLRAWAGLGYYARARNLHACAKVVATQYKGVFPSTMAALLALPGVGPYTAGAIAAIAFDQPQAAVDGNVERVISRLYAITEPLPLSKPEIRSKAQSLVPARRAGDFAQAMMDLGATICAPRKANCLICPWSAGCRGRQMAIAEQLPRKLPKAKVPTRHGTVFWATRADGAVVVRNRPAKGLLGGMTEFPSTEWREGEPSPAEPLFAADWCQTQGAVEHTFTHFHLVLKVQSATIKNLPEGAGFRFVSAEDLPDEALPSLMRKVMVHMGFRQP